MIKATLEELAKLTGASLIGDPKHEITNVEDLEKASSQDASFLTNAHYVPFLKSTSAGVICIDLKTAIVEGKNFLVSKNPSDTFQTLINYFKTSPLLETGFQGIHPSAIIHLSCKIGLNVSIGPGAVIDQNCAIGDDTIIGASCVICSGVQIGSGCRLYPNSCVREGCVLGNSVILQPGAVIGSCGFGYSTNERGVHTKQNQLGNVVIEDHVEIGANTTIDRARFKTTKISEGTKIDNLVQIGHNVVLGAHNLIVAQSGIAGSTKTGNNVVMGAQSGATGHIEIGDRVMIAAKSGVTKSIKDPGAYGGFPLQNLIKEQKQKVHLLRIETYVSRIEELEKKLSLLEKNHQKSNWIETLSSFIKKVFK